VLLNTGAQQQTGSGCSCVIQMLPAGSIKRETIVMISMKGVSTKLMKYECMNEWMNEQTNKWKYVCACMQYITNAILILL